MTRNVGIDKTLYRCAKSGASSTFTLAINTSVFSLAYASSTGAIMRQGPHHGAQKSMSTGVDDCKTTASKFAGVRSIVTRVYRTLPARPSTLFCAFDRKRAGLDFFVVRL